MTGLAAFCDVCGERISEHGYVVWNPDDSDDFLLIHQGRCDPGRGRYDYSMDLEAEIGYLANSVGADFDAIRSRISILAMLG